MLVGFLQSQLWVVCKLPSLPILPLLYILTPKNLLTYTISIIYYTYYYYYNIDRTKYYTIPILNLVKGIPLWVLTPCKKMSLVTYYASAGGSTMGKIFESRLRRMYTL